MGGPDHFFYLFFFLREISSSRAYCPPVIANYAKCWDKRNTLKRILLKKEKFKKISCLVFSCERIDLRFVLHNRNTTPN